MITRHDYKIGEYILSWDWDSDEQNARNFKDNNLYIEGLWNMSDSSVAKRPDTCVAMEIMDDETFQFTTFWGHKYVMRINGRVVEMVLHKCVF